MRFTHGLIQLFCLVASCFIAAEVAFLHVPQRHAEPAGASFKLRVVRLPAREPRGMPPVVYLAGGPGGSGVGTARGPRWPIFDRARRHVDVLLIDQRGTGGSQPPPVCSLTLRARLATATRRVDRDADDS